MFVSNKDPELLIAKCDLAPLKKGDCFFILETKQEEISEEMKKLGMKADVLFKLLVKNQIYILPVDSSNLQKYPSCEAYFITLGIADILN
jgi:hypothetical protein